MAKINIITIFVLCTISLIWTPFTSGVKTSEVKDKRGTQQSSYGSVLSPPYSPPDHGQVNSGFTPVAAPVGVYPQTPSAIGALLIPGNLLYSQGLDYSGLSYGGYGGYSGYPSVPASYPIGLLGSPQVAAYKLGPVTFNPAPAATPYVAAPAYPSYNILSSLNSDYAGIGSGYSLPSASYPSHNYGYSPSYASGSSYSSSYPSSSQSSYSSPSSHSSSTYSSSPSYSAFVGSQLEHQGGSSYSSYSSPSNYHSSQSNYHSSPSNYQSSPSNYQSSPSSYHSSSGYSSPGYSSQSSYSSPSNSYSHSSSSSYPSSAYGPPYKSSSGLSYKY